MAKDGLFFRSIAWVHPRTRVPVVAILLQGVVAMVIAVSSTFREIVNYVMTVELIFLSLTALSLFVIRHRDLAAYSTVLSVATLVFTAVNLALVLDLIYEYPIKSAVVIGIALTSVPAYFFWRRRPS